MRSFELQKYEGGEVELFFSKFWVAGLREKLNENVKIILCFYNRNEHITLQTNGLCVIQKN